MTPRYADDQPAGFSNKIKNVAIVGAAGQVGQHITAALLKTGLHTVTAITRPNSTSSFPDNVKIAHVDYDNHESLVNAMKGQDALVITMKVIAPADSVAKLAKAAIDAGVPWILPNEWGSDYTDPELNRDTMLGDDKLQIRRLIESAGTTSSWIAVACGFWYDYSLATGPDAFGFEFPKKQATFYDDGSYKMRFSTLPYCGQAVAKLLSLPILSKDWNDTSPCLEDYRNAIIRVHTFYLNQNDMLASVLRVTGDKKDEWTIKHESSEARYNDGKRRLQSGDRMGFRLMLYARMFYPSNPTKKSEDYSDERLGLEPLKLDDVTKWAVDKAMADSAA